MSKQHIDRFVNKLKDKHLIDPLIQTPAFFVRKAGVCILGFTVDSGTVIPDLYHRSKKPGILSVRPTCRQRPVPPVSAR